MPVDLKSLSMTDLRSRPGQILDRVTGGEAFIIERAGTQMACLVPLNMFLPDIQPKRVTTEFDKLQIAEEKFAATINDNKELVLRFREYKETLSDKPPEELTLTITLPHSYPNRCPRVNVTPIDPNSPHRWRDGTLCIFGITSGWNPGKHDVLYTLQLARAWLTNYSRWKQTGNWPTAGGQL